MLKSVDRPKPPAAGKGRVKGTPNKTTKLLKDAILKAAENAGGGDLVKYLEVQAIENPGPFLSLLGKVLPMQVTATVNTGDVSAEQREAALEEYFAARHATGSMGGKRLAN